MKIVFMGTPDFAVPCLKALFNDGHEIIQVITQPDRPKGRGHKLSPPPVKICAEELGLPVFQPEKIKTPEVTGFLRQLNPELIVVVAFGQILSGEILQIPPKGCINVHASILPKYRGAAPIHWAVINGEKVSGVSIMYMDEGLDTGDVVLVEEVSIGENDTTGMLYEKLSAVGATALVKALQLIDEGKAGRVPQDSNQATYADLIDKGLGQIDWTKSAADIKNLVRGLNPVPGAYTYLESKMVKVWDTELDNDAIRRPVDDIRPGTVAEVSPHRGIGVVTGQGILWIKEIQMQGSKRMKATDFLHGYSIKPGVVMTGGHVITN